MAQGRADYLAEGDWNAVCSICGRKRKASQLVKNWQGMWRCYDHNDPRQPQDFVRGIAENTTPPWTQPMPADVYSATCFPNDQSAIPNYAIPGCVKPAFIAIGNTIFNNG